MAHYLQNDQLESVMSNPEGPVAVPNTPNFNKQIMGGYSIPDVDAFVHQALKELDELRVQLQLVRAERDEAQAASSKAQAELDLLRDQMRSDRHLLQVLTDRVDELNKQIEAASTASASAPQAETVDDILRAAHSAAQQLRTEAQRDSEEMIRTAESKVERIISDMRRRGQELQAEFEMTRDQYKEFLNQVRALAQSFVRQVDEHDRPL